MNLKSYFGGLGDCLQFSTLPEMLTKAGNFEVYLCADAKYRSPEIKELVWGLNPYIKGESQGEWNCGDTPDKHYSNTQDDFIKNIEYMHGLTPTNSFPKIYYEPKKIKGIDGIIELSALSLKYNTDTIRKEVTAISKRAKFTFHQLETKNQSGMILLPDIPILKSNSLFEICDIIYSCKYLISLNSGIQALAAAIRRYNENFLHLCINPKADHNWIMESKKFVFPQIDYISF